MRNNYNESGAFVELTSYVQRAVESGTPLFKLSLPYYIIDLIFFFVNVVMAKYASEYMNL